MTTETKPKRIGKPRKYDVGWRNPEGITMIARNRTSKPNPRAMFRCHCGNTWDAVISNITTGRTKSCGCKKSTAAPLRQYQGEQAASALLLAAAIVDEPDKGAKLEEAKRRFVAARNTLLRKQFLATQSEE